MTGTLQVEHTLTREGLWHCGRPLVRDYRRFQWDCTGCGRHITDEMVAAHRHGNDSDQAAVLNYLGWQQSDAVWEVPLPPLTGGCGCDVDPVVFGHHCGRR